MIKPFAGFDPATILFDEKPMNQKLSPQNHNRFRGWTLTLLFSTLTVSCMLVLYALYLLRASFAENSWGFYITLFTALVAVLFNLRAAINHYKITVSGQALPRMPLKPFFFMALMLFFAGRLFGGL